MNRIIYFIFMFVAFSVTATWSLRALGVFDENFGRVEAGILVVSFFFVAVAMNKWHKENAERYDERLVRMGKKLFRLFR